MIDTHRTLVVAVASALLAIPVTVTAQIVAMDSAADTAYDDGWQTFDNGGFGFGFWTISAGQAIVTSSSNNGNPPPSANIDTSGRSWGLHDPIGGGFNAARPMNAPLAVGQTFIADVDFSGGPGPEI